MLIIFFRSIIVFLVLLIVMRLMGKRQIGEMQPFELVITLVISELATIPMADVSIPILYGVLSIFTLLILHHIVALVSRKSINMRKVICGRPTIVISPNGVDFKELRSLSMSVSDLLEAMRGAGYFSFDEIEYGIFETNGKFSVLPSSQAGSGASGSGNSNSTQAASADTASAGSSGKGGQQSSGKPQPPPALPLTLVEEGKIVKSTCKIAGVDESWLLRQIKRIRESDIKRVLVATLDNNGKMFIQQRGKKPLTLNTDFQGGDNW